MTAAQLLANAIDPPPPAIAGRALVRYPIPDGAFCAMRNCGDWITEGYRVQDVITTSFSDYYGVCTHFHGFLCEHAARMMAGDWNLGARVALLTSDGRVLHFHPVLSPASAEAGGRPAWRDLVRQLWADHRGAKCVILMTSDPKKRAWHEADIGELGSHTPVLISSASEPRTRLLVDWRQMLDDLDLIQEIRRAGFRAVRDDRPWPLADCLYHAHRTCAEVGWQQARQWEALLAERRGTPEFRVALFTEAYSTKSTSA